MIEIIKEKYKWEALNCANCQSDHDVKIINLQYDEHSGSMIYLCRECRKKLMELLICEQEEDNP